jgi:hypothetical protein
MKNYDSRYYDRDGKPMDMMTWAQSLEGDRRVGLDTLPDGKRVSTVWLGLDHNFDHDGPPLIFETMVFPPDSSQDLYCERYSTLAEAEAGHARVLQTLKDGKELE